VVDRLKKMFIEKLIIVSHYFLYECDTCEMKDISGKDRSWLSSWKTWKWIL
jgi:hypothetical protein